MARHQAGETAKDQDRLGEVVAAHRLAADILILAGWSKGEIVAEGTAVLESNRRGRGRFRAISCSGADGASARWFLAAINVTGAGEARSGEAIRLHGPGSLQPMVACLPSRILDAAAFAVELSERFGSQSGQAATFLLETFSTRAARQLRAVSALLAAVLEVAAEEDGVVEMVGPVEGEGVVLQGWLRHAAIGAQRLISTADEALEEVDVLCTTFARKDLEAPAAGFLALARGEPAKLRAGHDRIYLRTPQGVRRLKILPDVVSLPLDAVPQHVRQMLPALRADDAALRALRVVGRPRFTGVDTVSNLDRPVRMAIDLAGVLPGVGWYLTGWLLDPLGLVASVTLCDLDGASERLDHRWTRVQREDVTRGFAADLLFQGKLAHDRHGFTVFAPTPGGSGAWLELSLAGDHSVFMPLDPTIIQGHQGELHLLGSFDIHKPSATDIVEHQLGPLFHAAKGAPKRSIGYSVLRPGRALAGDCGAGSASLIIPIVDPACRTGILVAELATKPPGEEIAPLFVCSPSIGERSGALLRELAFYGIDAAVIIAEEAVGHCAALEIGVAATNSSVLVFLSPTAHPAARDWARRLVDALGDAAAASPTLLYEDWSVRHAGIDAIAFQDRPPYVEVIAAHAGRPRAGLVAGSPEPTLAALECCAIRRAAYVKVDGFSAGYVLPHLSGLDLFLRFRAAGFALLWVPYVEVYALDEDGAGDSYCTRTGERVDGWSFRASWHAEASSGGAHPTSLDHTPIGLPVLRRDASAPSTLTRSL
jgi:O-antigen biosynthesis protein